MIGLAGREKVAFISKRRRYFYPQCSASTEVDIMADLERSIVRWIHSVIWKNDREISVVTVEKSSLYTNNSVGKHLGKAWGHFGVVWPYGVNLPAIMLYAYEEYCRWITYKTWSFIADRRGFCEILLRQSWILIPESVISRFLLGFGHNPTQKFGQEGRVLFQLQLRILVFMRWANHFLS